MSFFVQYKRPIVLTSVIMILGTIITWVWGALVPNHPKIISTQPATNTRNVDLFVQLGLAFDTEALASDISISSDPQENWHVNQTSSNTVTAKSEDPLVPSKPYSITVSWKNNPIYNFSFTTASSQSDLKLLKNIKTEVDRDYPLAKLTPLDSSLYRVVYSSPLTLEITIKNVNLTTAEIIEEVKSWVTQNGGDAASHKYVIANTTP